MLQEISRNIIRLEKQKCRMLEMLDQAGEDVSFAEQNGIAQIPLRAESLKELRVAAIMDQFTLECFRPECDLMELTPDAWKEEMEETDPELLFVESAWEGKNGLWHGKINHCAKEYRELVEYCHQHKIPVVFWNKEDPVWTDVFMNAARLADVVFTTELECVEKYKTELEHDQVYHLHFAAQPCIHNPIETRERKDKFNFAGAYYHRYVERCQVFDSFSEYFIRTKGLDIYDRNYPSPRPEHAFPDWYTPYILGRLEPSEIDKAYKGYYFGINMNSVAQSQTMFARRVFELMASNTIVVGNYSRGLKNYFGDLTICTNDAEMLEKNIKNYGSTLEDIDRFRLLALRRVLQAHLYEDRLDFIVRKVFGRSMKRELPLIFVCSKVDTQEEADRIIEMFQKQTYKRKRLILVTEKEIEIETETCANVVASVNFMKYIKNTSEQETYLSYFHPLDWYGKNYLMDLALTRRYGDFDVIGKSEYYESKDGTILRTMTGKAYHKAGTFPARRSMIRLHKVDYSIFKKDAIFTGENGVSIDALNYCENWQKADCPQAEDLVLPDQGLSLERMEEAAILVNGRLPVHNEVFINAKTLDREFKQEEQNKMLSARLSGNEVIVDSCLPGGENEYVYLSQMFHVPSVCGEDGSFYIRFNGEAYMNVICGCIFYDPYGKKIAPHFVSLQTSHHVIPPENTEMLRIFYRFSGAGKAKLISVILSSKMENVCLGDTFLSRSQILVLTNQYPSKEKIYSNMFVHRRVLAYRKKGYLVDVMCMHPDISQRFREFDGINVVEGNAELLESILSNGCIETVCVHFMSRSMWEVLKNHLGKIRLLIWLHGAEVQPWWRRSFNYTTPKELDEAKKASEGRVELWNEIFDTAETARIHFVFVSNYFAEEVMRDYRRSIPKEKYSVIHNLIDTDVFQYHRKNREQRKHILTIKSFYSAKYGNDITTKAILELSSKPFFSKLFFSIYGKGEEFEKTNAALREFSNVYLHECFLLPEEISRIHKKYGVYIATTRWDSQGASRDEAMSSGLVPIANAVAAIPEFVDDTCGILVPGEDYKAVADAVERLYYEPELFLKLSENAAKRVRRQSSEQYTIDREIKLIFEYEM